MKIKKTRLICAVNGCRNKDTYFITRSGVPYNSPNICKDCAKLAYEALFADEIKVKSISGEKVQSDDKAENESGEDKEDAVSGGFSEKKARKKE